MAIKYVPYPIRALDGQAVLDNFVRTRRVLRYRDANRVYERILRGMPLYEVELKEGTGQSENLLLRGECLSACAYLKEHDIKVDLVYIDPPFASGADYAKKVYLRRNPKLAEAQHEAEQTLDDDALQGFEEKMYGDIWDKERYLNWMYENLCAIKAVMSDSASIYVHLDYHIGHYVKVLMDEIFGEQNFLNEIIWQKLKAAKKQAVTFGNVHDTIFYYALNKEEFLHNKQYKNYSQELIDSHYNHVDENGRRYTDDSFTQTGQGPARVVGERGLLEPPTGKHWIWSQERIDQGLKDGTIIFTSQGTPRVKRYLDEREGIAVSDIWTEITPVNSQADEALDYATQKPEALLERIIKASSNEGMVVADFFGGSGVTAAVAARLGRRFIHSDVGINSIQTARDRLKKLGATFDVMEVKDGVQLYRNPVQTMEKLKGLIQGLRNEDALDKFWEGSITTTKDGMVPVYLPNLMDSSTRLLDKPLMNRIIREAMPDLPDNVKRVIVYYIDITDEKEIQQFIKEQNTETLIEIELRDLKQVLSEVVVDDEVTCHTEAVKEGLLDAWRVTIDGFLSDRVLERIRQYNEKSAAQAQAKGRPYKPLCVSDEGLECIEWVGLDCDTADKNAPWHSTTEIHIKPQGQVVVNGKPTDRLWDGTITTPDERRPLRMKVRNICGDETTVAL